MNKKSKKRYFGASILVLALAGGVGGYVYAQRPSTVQAGPTIEVQRGMLKETAAASGNIAPHTQVEVKSRASGEVIELLVKEGDKVEAGQLLARLDPAQAERDLASAKVALEKIKADIAASQASLAVSQLDRSTSQQNAELATQAADLGVGPKDAIRTTSQSTKVANANVALKSAQLTAIQANLKTAELTVQDAETRVKETKIYAPMAGTVLDIPVEKGTIVTSALTSVSGGTAVMTLADLSDLRIIGAIDEAQISRVAPEQAVEIRVDAYPDRVFEGKVERVSPLGKTVSSVVTFDVEIVVTDKNAALLRSGMSADVEIVTAKQEDVLLVPLVAVETSGRARFVRLANGEQRPIKTGATDGNRMIVLEGIDEGDTILAAAPAPSGQKSAAPQGQGNPMMGGGMSGGNRQRSK